LRLDPKSIGVLLGSVAVAVGAASSVHALPAPEPPRSAPTGASPAPEPSGASLPFGTPLYFVLDQAVSSASTPSGTTIDMHLRAPLVVNGVTLAAAGTPASFNVVSTRKAQSGDVDGAVRIYVNPMALPQRNLTLPLRAIHEYLSREMSAGQMSTRMATDTVEDVFVPYAFLYQILRKGHQMVMPVGTILRAETAATIDASNPARVVLATPPPFVSNYDAPHSDLTPAPFYTPAAQPAHPLQKGKPTIPPRSPSPSAVESAAVPQGSSSAVPSGSMPAAVPVPSASVPPAGPSGGAPSALPEATASSSALPPMRTSPVPSGL